MPHCFPAGTEQSFRSWLETVTRCDAAICISRAVADELAQWTREHAPERPGGLQIDWFHIGADIGGSVPSRGMPADASGLIEAISKHPSFLLVGTLEPRKRHAQTLDAFERLWARGSDARLVIVGKRGWLVDGLCDRLRMHPEAGKRLFWLEAISDEYLEKIYAAATCLIFPSEGEGFGLPLIEAAQHGLPILARDLPVFREVAGERAAYFGGRGGDDLARAVLDWLKLHRQGRAPASDGLTYLTWEQSTERLLECLLPPATRH
jgi:glycosyltransferase involved in cell wall biosynthesis